MVAFEKIFNSRFKYLILAWGIIVLFVLMQMKLVGYYKTEMRWPTKDYAIYFISQMLIGICLIYFFITPIYDKIKELKSVPLKLISFLCHGLVFGFLHVLIMSLLYEVKKNNGITNEFKDRFYNLFFTDLHNSIKTYLILIAILFAYDYFRKNTNHIITQKNLENEMDRVKLQSLRAQLQPHFLFNALNNVVALIDENKKKAQQSLIYLSDLLRHTINLKPQEMVPIEEEIQLIKKYVNIEKSKYEDQLEVIWLTEKDHKGKVLPPLIVQPLIENAIKHGFVDNCKVLTIEISIKPNLIRVKNNGSALSVNYSRGQGLSIVQKRLAIHYKNKSEFKLFMENDWVVNEIVIYENI